MFTHKDYDYFVYAQETYPDTDVCYECGEIFDIGAKCISISSNKSKIDLHKLCAQELAYKLIKLTR